MNRRLVDVLVLMLLGAPLAFLWLTAQALPDPMASHFNGSGAADAFAPSRQYLQIMSGLSVGLPLLLGFALPALFGRMVGAINLPNREYWLAPQRQESTLAYLRAHIRGFALMLAAFMTFIHALVVEANRLQPPHLDVSSAQTGLLVFLIATGLWLLALLLHFRRPR